MSLANFCVSLSQRKPLLEKKTRTGARVKRFNDRILLDVSVNPQDRPDWYLEFDSIARRCYSVGGAGGILAPEWHKASNFRDWWEATEDTSADLVVTWNIVRATDGPLEYSPATGMFFPEAVKHFFMPQIRRSTELGWIGMLGVGRRYRLTKTYSAREYRRNERAKHSHHATELEAHTAWLVFKAGELSEYIAAEPRPEAKAVLQSRLERIQHAIENRLELTFL